MTTRMPLILDRLQSDIRELFPDALRLDPRFVDGWYALHARIAGYLVLQLENVQDDHARMGTMGHSIHSLTAPTDEGSPMPQPDKDQVIEQMLQRERFECDGGGSVSTPMPLYKCHKDVWALKIADVIDPTNDGNESDGSRILVIAEAGYSPIRVPHDYVRKHDPKPGGYYVVYKDGYKSFSPAQAFEEGYSRA